MRLTFVACNVPDAMSGKRSGLPSRVARWGRRHKTALRWLTTAFIAVAVTTWPLIDQVEAPASPPRPPAHPEAGHLVDLAEYAPDLLFDIRYARPDNFTGKVLYPVARALLARGTAEKLIEAKAALAAQGYRLLIWDAYRPLSVQQEMWDLVQDPRYVGDPSKGVRHARACAVDLTLADAGGRPVAMPSGFDHFGPEAGVDWPGHPPEVRARALLLRDAMVAAGFRPSTTEWWHFSDSDWQLYPELDLPVDVAVPAP